MQLNQQLKDMLLKINDTLPPEKRAEFVGRIRQRLSYLQVDDLAGYTDRGCSRWRRLRNPPARHRHRDR